jgi:hypothetical protein
MKRKREGLSSEHKEDLSLSDPQEQAQEIELAAHCHCHVDETDSEHPITPITALSLFAGRKLSTVPLSLFLPKFQLCVSLGTLNLSRNEIKKLPAAIGSLVALVHLDVSRNFIRRLPQELQALVNLKHCNASSNQFKGLPDLALDQLATLPALRVLDLRRNGRIGEYGANHAELLAAKLGPRIECLVSTKNTPTEHAADRDATLIKCQMGPHCTGVLRRRLSMVFGDTTDPEKVEREEVMERLLTNYARTMPRAIRRIQGVPVSRKVCCALQEEMDKWVATDLARRQLPNEVRERPTIDAQHYMILTSVNAFANKTSHKAKRAAWKLGNYQDMWDCARAVLEEVDPAFTDKCTAVAFTKNFVGSPHIDTENLGPFYGLALGDFVAPGGALCVEVSAREVAHVDTRHRLGRVDGRYPHWVAPYEGNRYSVIYYHTKGAVIPRGPAVFTGSALVDDPPTFPQQEEDSYYHNYDRETGTYNPSS